MEEFDGVRCRGQEIESFIAALMRGAGASEESAAAVARALTEASARGVDTHGIRLAPLYFRAIEGGRINPRPTLRIERVGPAVLHVDADDGLGHFASYRAIEAGIAVARESGVAAVAIGRSTHHGSTGGYTIAAARQGYAALGMTNATAIVVPHGGAEPFLGTNPITFAVPRTEGHPLVLDMATSSIPFNRVLLRRDTGTPLPPEVAVDAEGNVTADPFAAAGLMPLGGANYSYKGAGLGVMVEILCSAFTGAMYSSRVALFTDEGHSNPARLGHFFLIFDPATFQPLPSFHQRLEDFIGELKGLKARPGETVMAPGDPEWAAYADRAANGLPIDAVTWAALGDYAARYGCRRPEAVGVSRANGDGC
jgi:LDH2 family malate/lactate/ureidoglycolate dehydrogenase